jgi:hypothetical protein
VKTAFGLPAVAWRERIIGPVDPATGKATFTWVEHSIEALVRRVNAMQAQLEVGVASSEYLQVHTLEGIKAADQILYRNRVYEVLLPRQLKFGSDFPCRRALLCRLKLEGEAA